MKLSRFGQQFAGQSGIVELMGDLGSALNENPDMIFMGGGNPGRLMAVEAVFQKRLEQIMADPAERHSLFGIYQSPQGDLEFREVLAGDCVRPTDAVVILRPVLPRFGVSAAKKAFLEGTS